MNESDSAIKITFRIPGTWSHPKELVEAMPEGYRLTPEALVLPDATEVEFTPMPPDRQFAEIFRSSCRRPPTDDEQAKVAGYTVNVCLSGPGGSPPAVLRMMRAAAAVIEAGGAGVFIDNSALAHGGHDWLAMTEDAGHDALSFAFVAIIGSRTDVWTMGMHTLGLRDILMKRVDADRFDPIEVIRYLCRNEKPIDDGHILADLDGPRFRAMVQPAGKYGTEIPPGSRMYNPFGRLKLVSTEEIAESN